jgi:SulP family sulfate permease
MIGFLTGISVNIVCGQVAGFTGAQPHGRIACEQAVSVLLHPGRINLAALLTGLTAIAILLVTSRTRAAQAGTLLAVVVPTIVVAAASADSVGRVRDIGHIQPGIPLPGLPDFGVLSYGMITGALAVTAIIVVQGAGVSEIASSDGPAVPGAAGMCWHRALETWQPASGAGFRLARRWATPT